MHAKTKSNRGYHQAIELGLDGIHLLRVIKLICFNIEDEKYVPQKVHEVEAPFYALKQGRGSDQVYQTKFLNIMQVIEECSACLSYQCRYGRSTYRHTIRNNFQQNSTHIILICFGRHTFAAKEVPEIQNVAGLSVCVFGNDPLFCDPTRAAHSSVACRTEYSM